MTEIQDRIKEIRLFLCDGNNKKFAQKLGISEVQASAMCSGQYKPGAKALDNILDAFPQVSRAWLVLGEGVSPMMNVKTEVNADSSSNSTIVGNMGDNNNVNTQTASLTDKLIELYEQRISDKDTIIEQLNSRVSEQSKIIDVLATQIRKEGI